MGFLELLVLLLVYIGGVELLRGESTEGKRFLWPVRALLIGVRIVIKALRGLFANHQTDSLA